MFWDSVKTWFVDNIRQIAAAVAAFMVVLAVAAAFAEFRKHQEKSGVEALYKARQEISALPIERQRSEGPGIYKKVIAAHSRSRAAFEAMVSIGDIYNEAKNYGEAAKAFDEASKHAPDDFAKMLALYNKGSAEEAGGNCDAAIASYATVSKNPAGKFLAPEVLLAEGRCLETKKDFAQATTVYQRIQSEYPNNPYYAGAAQVFMEKIKVQSKN